MKNHANATSCAPGASSSAQLAACLKQKSKPAFLAALLPGLAFLLATLLLVLLSVAITSPLYSQVVTQSINSGSLTDFIPLHSDKIVPVEVLPDVDVEAALAEDEANGVQIPRFAVKIPTFFPKSDGDVEMRGSRAIWKAAFKSVGAISLNFQFTDLALPEGSQLFIYNSAGTMSIGPVDGSQVFNGKFNSDIVKGDEATVEVIVPKASFESFNINIAYVNHGFVELDFRDYGDAELCNVDVNCTFGGSGGGIRDAVALILVNGEALCSGALINNACGDSRSFFLTAEHCVDGSANTSGWAFRFNYDSPDPGVPACHGSEPITWLTFSGAVSRARSSASDFALLELNNSVVNQGSIRLAGWNRAAAAPTDGTGIHHPNGDVKKINFDSDPLVITGWQGVNNSHLEVNWESGITEGGSSGSPLFSNNLIVGQLSGIIGSTSCSNPGSYYGRFFTSWTGGGTSNTRLSDWLGNGSSSPTTTGTTAPVTVSGASPVCTTNKTFTLQNSAAGSAITWAVTPTSLFATGGGASTSGTGTSATLRALSSSSKGEATLTYTITPDGTCAPFTVIRFIWVGKPGIVVAGDDYLCTLDKGFTDLTYIGNSSQGAGSNISWSYSGPLTNFTILGDIVKYKAASYPGTGYISASVTNACGTTVENMPYEVVNCDGGGGHLIVSPNPSTRTANLQLDNKSLNNNLKTTTSVYDKTGAMVLQMNGFEMPNTIDVSSLRPDVYFIEIVNGNQRFRQRLVVIR